MSESRDQIIDPDEFDPSLRAALSDPPYDPKLMLHVPISANDNGPIIEARGSIVLMSGKEGLWHWKVDSLVSLFRGNVGPTTIFIQPQPEYELPVMIMDLHLADFARVVAPPRDAELLEIFSRLRRRPDGRSESSLHDFLWRASALALGMKPLSQFEFEALMSRMEKSCRGWMDGSTSRNKAENLLQGWNGR